MYYENEVETWKLGICDEKSKDEAPSWKLIHIVRHCVVKIEVDLWKHKILPWQNLMSMANVGCSVTTLIFGRDGTSYRLTSEIDNLQNFEIWQVVSTFCFGFIRMYQWSKVILGHKLIYFSAKLFVHLSFRWGMAEVIHRNLKPFHIVQELKFRTTFQISRSGPRVQIYRFNFFLLVNKVNWKK